MLVRACGSVGKVEFKVSSIGGKRCIFWYVTDIKNLPFYKVILKKNNNIKSKRDNQQSKKSGLSFLLLKICLHFNG